MKAILEFDLNDKDDRLDHFRAIMAREMSWTLSDILEIVKKLEYLEDDDKVDKHQYVDALREAISAIYNENGIDMNQLVY